MIKTKITCIVGDLTKQPDCDAIVNSANTSMRLGSGVCGAIHRAAGRELEKFGIPLGPLSLGQAVITPGFNLPNRFVIHLSAPKYHLDPDPSTYLALAISNALKLAEENVVKRIALPAIATGIYGYPIEEAVKVFVQTARQFINSEVLEEIRFVFFTPEDAEIMQQYVKKVSLW
jgi:O-acetyl-ADP-ribose deacetylase (regulator of RNase III)